MPRDGNSHMADDKERDTFAPKHLLRQEFGRRVYAHMLKMGWNQSELGRRSGIPRAAISTYVKGQFLPSSANLAALAKAFGVAPSALLPSAADLEPAVAAAPEVPTFELRVVPNDPRVAFLRVNRLVMLSTGVKIAALLEDDHVSDGSGSSSAAAV